MKQPGETGLSVKGRGDSGGHKNCAARVFSSVMELTYVKAAVVGIVSKLV